MAKESLTQKSKKYLEREGWVVGVVEQMIPHTFIKRDLFGMFDLIAVRGTITMGVQVTSRSNVKARINKIEEEPRLADIREAGWWAQVHGWDKGSDKKDRLRIEDIS